jgi:hypothetical protein
MTISNKLLLIMKGWKYQRPFLTNCYLLWVVESIDDHLQLPVAYYERLKVPATISSKLLLIMKGWKYQRPFLTNCYLLWKVESTSDHF